MYYSRMKGGINFTKSSGRENSNKWSRIRLKGEREREDLH